MEAASLSTKIALQLEQDILTGRLSLGERLDERDIAEQFSVSRTPVREALKRLEGFGLVQINGRYGSKVARLNLTQLLDAFLVVSELEALASYQAASRITPEEVAFLWDCQAECSAAYDARDVDAFCAANDRLHEAILDASGNWMLHQQIRVARVLGPYRRHITHQPGRMDSSLREHAAFIAAIEAGDATRAADLMRAHVNALAHGLSDFLIFLKRTGKSEIIGETLSD